MAATMPKLGVAFFSLVTFLIVGFSSLVSSKGQLVTITEDTWTDLLDGEWMVEFYAPWCPACKALEPVWKEFSSWSDDLGLKIGGVDITTQPGISGRFLLTALPTIYHVKDGVFRQYRGSRDKDSFISFVEERKWESIEPVNKWVHPASFQMSVVSTFFKFSMLIRELHNKIIEFGVPYWMSYILFAVATILVGTILGLILVVVVEFFFPPKYDVHKEKTEDRSDDKNDNEVEDDIVEDDTPDSNDTELRHRKPPTEDSVSKEN